MVRRAYQQTEVGVIPDDWDVCTGEELTSLISKGASPRWQGYAYCEFGLLFVTSENVRNGFLDISSPKYLPMEFNSKISRTQLQFGDILINLVGASIGRSCRVERKIGIANVNQAVAVFRVKDGTSSRYILQYLQMPNTIRRIVGMQVDAARSNISLGNLRQFKIGLPKVKEQSDIADALSDADALIESLEKLIAKKRLIKQGAMQELLSGKRRLAGFSGKWPSKPLSELFEFSGGVSASRDQLSSEGVCYLHYGDIHLSQVAYVDVDKDAAYLPRLNIPIGKAPSSAILRDGDVVFVDASEDSEGASKHVTISNKAGVPYISGLHTIVAKAKNGEVSPLYRRYCFQTEAIKRQFVFYAVGTKVTGVSKSNIGKIILTYPPTEDEQISIAETLIDMDTEIASLEQKVGKARQIKQGMMQELLTGRIRLI